MLSVIIPTHKRPDILRRCLEHLAKQTVQSEIEVIVVSDGHDDKTAQLFGNNQDRPETGWPQRVRYFEIPKSQQGQARNEGVRQAKGEYILFIGDDIFLDPKACERHLDVFKSQACGDIPQAAVLGYTTWDPEVGITPVMSWLEKSGWQFGYPNLKRYENSFIPAEIQHKYVYTSQISLPAETARKFPFRTDVHLYGWEDIEWGIRLENAGVRLYYEPEAKAWHHHRMTTEDSLKRMKTLGQSVMAIEKLIPGFDRRPRGLKFFMYRIAALLPTMAGYHRREFIRGMLA